MKKSFNKSTHLPFLIDSPLYMRCEPKMPYSIADEIILEAEKICREFKIKDLSDDLSPFMCPWVTTVRKEFKKLMKIYFESEIEIDWNFSATLSMVDLVLQSHAILPKKETRVYIDDFDGLWSIRQVDNLAESLWTRTRDISQADVVILTHVIPEVGSSSLDNLDLSIIKNDAIILIDAAQFFTTLFTKPYRDITDKILSQYRSCFVGDMHKLMGYGIRSSVGTSIPISFSINIYSRDFFYKRLKYSRRANLPKNPDQQNHWDIIYTRKILNSMSSMQIIYPLAFLRLFSTKLVEMTRTALEVASQLREEFNAEGQSTFVTLKIDQKIIDRNKVYDKFLLDNRCYSIYNEEVLPIVIKKGEAWGFIQVYVIMAMMGRENLVDYYRKVIKHFFI